MKNYYHFSDTPIYKNKLKEDKIVRTYNKNTTFCLNPVGLWYTVNFSFQEKLLKRDNYAFLARPYVYKLDLNLLNIRKIKNLDDLIDFVNYYFKEKPKNNFKNLIDWERVKEDYDGLEVNKKTLNQLLKKDINGKFDNLDEYTKALIKRFDDKNHEWIRCLWIGCWESESGVIFKNYHKLKLKRINVKIQYINKKVKIIEI